MWHMDKLVYMLLSQNSSTYQAKDKLTNLCTGDEILIAGPEHKNRCSTSQPCSRQADYIFSKYFPTQTDSKRKTGNDVTNLKSERQMERKQAEGKNKDKKTKYVELKYLRRYFICYNYEFHRLLLFAW
jgi:hypothetical protein